mmetsp:Transcript_16489/g.11646  ORF Transcript_16489/g.11646 Transcript_16489/m.11646 type:complete len:233 (+) Transcript_16489:271-969(+)
MGVVGTCVLVFLITNLVYSSKDNTVWECVLYDSQAKYTYAITRKYHVQRLVMPMVLHTGTNHLLFNMLSMFMIGFYIESLCLKKIHYLMLLVVSAVGGNVMSALADVKNISVGFSGALFGILGCYLTYALYNRDLILEWKRTLCIYALLLFFNIVWSFASPTIDFYAHLGGFFVGFAMAPFVLKPRSLGIPAIKNPIPFEKFKKFCLGFLIGYFIIFTVALFLRPIPDCENE